MRNGLTLLAMLAGALLLALPVAQAQDVRVAFDKAGTVDVIDAGLREQLGLFGEVDGFEEARLFRQGGNGEEAYELVIHYREGEQLLRQRRMLSAREVAELRRRVSASRTEDGRIRPRAQLQDGRYRFLASTTVLGAFEGALFAVAAAPEDDGKTVLASSFLGATAGFFGPMLITRNTLVTESEATLTGYGGVQGITHGILLGTLFVDEEADGRGVAAATGALGIVESIVGMRLAHSTAMRSGTAETVTFGGLYGTGLGISAGLLVAGDGEGRAAERAAALGGLAGSLGGAYGGYRLGRAAGYTQGDARIFGTAGLLGSQLASTVLVLADGGELSPRAAAGTVIAGTLGGLGLGHTLVRGRNFSTVQGNVTALGALVGSLAGSATGIVVDTHDEGASLLSTLGAFGGFVGTWALYRGAAASQARSEGGGTLRIGLGSGAALPGGTGGPLGDATPALNLRLSL